MKTIQPTRDNQAQATKDYPTKPVRIIEPFGPGGGPDLLARALAEKLSELWGEPVIVENVPGSGATAGPAQVANSPADGYTLLMNTNAQAYSAVLLKSLPYDPVKDFIPVIALTSQPYVLVAGKAAGTSTVGELIAAARTNPGELKFGSAGIGTGTHLAAVKFNLESGILAVHVPSKPDDAIADIIAATIEGRNAYMIAPISIALRHIRDGGLIGLGVSTARRSILLPEVPTIAEAGIPGFDFPIWYGVWVPVGTPAGIVSKLANDFTHVLAGADLRSWVAKHGGEPMSMTQPQFAQFVQSEIKNAARLIEAAGIKFT